MTAAGIIGVFVLPTRYESSTTILVQGQGVLNPLVNYTMAVAMQSDDRLRDFNEIVYSTPILEALMDSLGMRPQVRSEAEREQLLKEVSKNIRTERNGSESFTLSYMATVPRTAQRAVGVLAQLFIQTRLRDENSKNDFAVEFFSQRLNGLRDKFEQSQQQLVDAMKLHASTLPANDRIVYSQIDDFDKQISVLQKALNDYQRALSVLQTALASEHGVLDMKSLFEIPLLGVPYATELQSALSKFDELQHKYTPEYPTVRDERKTLFDLLRRTQEVVQSDSKTKQSQIWSLEQSRHKGIETVQQASVAQNQDQDVQSNFAIYKELYNDMKIKLEQAQTSRDLGENGAREFVVIDPPQVPTSPAKPNRPLLIGGAFSLGLILGLFAAGAAEMFDATIRTPMDVEIYEKPVLAFLPSAAPYSKQP